MRRLPAALRCSRRHGARGASLVFALVALVVLGFAAAALAFSVQAGASATANLAARHGALHAGSTGAEQAIAWLQDNAGSAVLDADAVPEGYYAAAPARLDATASRTSATNRWILIDWDGNCQGVAPTGYLDCTRVPRSGTSVHGHQVQFVILRFCQTPGSIAGGVACIRPDPASSPYYQVLARVSGPRGTVVYTETMVRFTDAADPASLRRTGWRELVD